MSKKEEIVGDASIYSSMSILTQIITLAAAILTRRFLGPVQTGVWALLQILLVYAAYSTLGVTQSAYREIPFYRGKGDLQKAEEIKNLVHTFSFLMSSIVAAGCVIYALFMKAKLPPEVFYGFLFMPVLIMLQRASDLRITLLRGYKLFALAAKQMVFSALANALLVVLLSYKFKVYGFMLAMCLSFLFTIFYIQAHHAFHFKWHFDLGKIGGLIQYGFPLVIVSVLSSLFITIDKLMIAKIIGIEQLGFYSVALLAYTYLNSLPNSIGIVLIPNFHQKFGETESAASLSSYLEKASGFFEVVMPLLIGTGWFLIPYFAQLLLPDFKGSIPPMKYLITSVFWIALTGPYSHFLVVIRKQLSLVPIIGSACVLAFLANLFALTHGFGILGVGVVTTTVIFFNFTATYFLARKYFSGGHEVFRCFLRLVFKFTVMVLAMVFLNRCFPRSEYSLWRSLIQFLIFSMLCFPFLYKQSKELRIIPILRKKLFGEGKSGEPFTEKE